MVGELMALTVSRAVKKDCFEIEHYNDEYGKLETLFLTKEELKSLSLILSKILEEEGLIEKVRKDWEKFMEEPLNRAIFERLSEI
jgi:hypothetical protein